MKNTNSLFVIAIILWVASLLDVLFFLVAGMQRMAVDVLFLGFGLIAVTFLFVRLGLYKPKK